MIMLQIRKICHWEELPPRSVFPNRNSFSLVRQWVVAQMVNFQSRHIHNTNGNERYGTYTHGPNKLRALHASLAIPIRLAVHVCVCVYPLQQFTFGIFPHANCMENKCEQTRIFDGGWDNDILIKVIVFNLPN